MLDQHAKPTEEIDLREVFGLDSDMKVKGFAEHSDRVRHARIRRHCDGGGDALAAV